MINEDKDSSLIISIKSPSNILSAVLDRQAKYNLQLKKCKKLLGTRVESNDPMCINSADKFIKNAAKNHYSFENGLKYTETVLGIFSLPFSKMT